jgi:hypothetical protein
MAFTIPPPDPPAAPEVKIELPAELQAELAISVARFEQQWGMLSALARTQGYTERYKIELTAMMKLAYEKGRACTQTQS